MVDRKARYERRQRTGKRRLRESRRARLRNFGRTILMATGGLAIVALLVGGIVLYTTSRKELPPTSAPPGHAETLPPRQINTSPIPRRVQQHVMERNATHPPGQMLVQYNCVDYQCEPDLVATLTKIVGSYQPTVYLAPYPQMDAKIALAAPGRLLTLENLDEQRIRKFISDNLTR